MKTFAVILLCAFAAVQGRSAAVKSTRTEAALGENPWVVHIRTAVSTSGLLNSCAGSLIDNLWVLTSFECLRDSRFVWVRYGAVDVIRPELVTESSIVRTSPDGVLALLNINRFVESTDNISPIGLGSVDPLSVGSFCGYGSDESGGPGETLRCNDLTLVAQEDGSVVGQSDAGATTQFDIGAPLVADGTQIGVLVTPGDDDSAGNFALLTDYLGWIESETGLSLGGEATIDAVKFVN